MQIYDIKGYECKKITNKISKIPIQYEKYSDRHPIQQ